MINYSRCTLPNMDLGLVGIQTYDILHKLYKNPTSVCPSEVKKLAWKYPHCAPYIVDIIFNTVVSSDKRFVRAGVIFCGYVRLWEFYVTCLISKCRKEFDLVKQNDRTDYYVTCKDISSLRTYSVTLCSFIAELFVEKVFEEDIVYNYINDLLINPSDISIDCACTVLLVLQRQLHQESREETLDKYFDAILAYRTKHYPAISSNVQLLINWLEGVKSNSYITSTSSTNSTSEKQVNISTTANPYNTHENKLKTNEEIKTSDLLTADRDLAKRTNHSSIELLNNIAAIANNCENSNNIDTAVETLIADDKVGIVDAMSNNSVIAMHPAQDNVNHEIKANDSNNNNNETNFENKENKKKKSKKAKKKSFTEKPGYEIDEIESLERIRYEIPFVLDQLILELNLNDVADEIRILYGTIDEKKLILEVMFDYALSRNEIHRNATGELLLELTIRGFINVDLIISQIQVILESATDSEHDIPYIWRNLAEILYPLFREEYISFLNLKHKLNLSHDLKNAVGHNFVCNILNVLKKMQGETWVMLVAWDNTLIKFSDFIPIGRIRSYIRQFDLVYLAKRPCIIDPQTKRISEITIQKIITDYLRLDKEKAASRILKFCTDNIGPDVHKPEFLRALTSAICLFSVGNDHTLNSEILQGYVHIIDTYVAGNRALQMNCASTIHTLYLGLAITCDCVERIMEIFKNNHLIPTDFYHYWAISLEREKLNYNHPYYVGSNVTFSIQCSEISNLCASSDFKKNPELTNDEIDLRSKAALEKYCSHTDVEDIIIYLQQWLYPPSYKQKFILYLIKYTVQKNISVREHLGTLIGKLILRRLLYTSHVVEGLANCIKSWVNIVMIGDSKCWKYMADIIAPLLIQDIITFEDLRRASICIHQTTTCANYISRILFKVKQLMGKEAVCLKWNACNMKLTDFIKPENEDEFVKQFNLQYLLCPSMRSVDCNDAKLETKFRSEITRLIVSNKKEEISSYVINQVRNNSQSKKAIIQALPVIFELETEQTRNASYSTFGTCVQNVIGNGDMNLEVLCLNSVYDSVNKLHFPEGMLSSICDYLKDSRAISIQGFLKWIETFSDDKQMCFKQLKKYCELAPK